MAGGTGLLSAFATGLGAFPVSLARMDTPRIRGLATAFAAGMMIGASLFYCQKASSTAESPLFSVFSSGPRPYGSRNVISRNPTLRPCLGRTAEASSFFWLCSCTPYPKAPPSGWVMPPEI